MAPLRILIAEDEAVIAMLLGEVLDSMGHSICATVSTDHDAIVAVAAELPDLLIVDAGLGLGSGVDAVAQIVALRHIPHIFMTGNVSAVRQLRPDAVILEKPFNEAELREAIERAFR